MKEFHLPAHDDEPLSERERRKIRRSLERHPARVCTKLGTIALGAALILHTDITINKLRLSHTDPHIHRITEAIDPENRDEMTVYMDGFAGNDGSWITSKMAPAMQAARDTNIAALEYDQNGISVPEIAKDIAAIAAEDNLETVSLHGYSIGGMIALETAAILQEKYGITVPFIFLDQTPSTANTIKATVRDPASTLFVDIMGTAKTFGLDIEYSGIARGIFDTVSPNDVSHLKDSTTKLMRDQFIYGTSTDTEVSVERLGKNPFTAPTLVYLSSTSPERDYMVDLPEAENDYRELAETYGLGFITIQIEDAIHSRPDLTLDAYQTAMDSAHDEIATITTPARDMTESLSRALRVS